MVGGKVIEVAEVPGRPGVLYVDCADMPKGRKKPDTCAIMVERTETSERIQIGDSLWWQGRSAMWTPHENLGKEGRKQGIDFDIIIPRVGYSGVKHPMRESERA